MNRKLFEKIAVGGGIRAFTESMENLAKYVHSIWIEVTSALNHSLGGG
jgi:shikimate kinase